MSTSGEKAVEEMVTVKTLIWVAILAVVLTAFWDAFTLLLPRVAFCTQNVSNLIPAFGVELMGIPFLMLLFSMGLMRVRMLRKHLTTTNLAILYATTLAVAYFANTSLPWGYHAGLIFTRLFSTEEQMRYVPEFIVPSRDAALLLYRGAGLWTVPWATLIPEIIWHFLLMALFGGVSIGLASIFRRQWVDVEVLPFPQVLLAYTCLVNVESSVKPKWPSKTPFLIGMLFGLLLVAPVSAVTLFPWFPDILMWRTNTCGHGAHQLTFPDIPWHLSIPKYIPLYVFMLLIPLHLLGSIVFYVLVMEIAVFTSFYAFGYYTSMLQQGFCGRSWCLPNFFSDPPLNLWSVNTGNMLGLFVITILMQRRYILDTLKSAFGKTSKPQEEPISYKASWLILLTSFILLTVFFIASGFSPWASIVMPLVGIITWFTFAQLWGRLGFMTSPDETIAPGPTRLLLWPTLSWPTITSQDLALVPYITEAWIGHQSITGWGGSFYAVLGSYKMARLTGVNPRNLLKVTVISLFISMFVTKVVQEVLLSIVGASKFTFPTIKATAIDVDRFGCFWGRPSPQPIIQAIPWILAGFIFMIVMRSLYSRFLWLPDPLAAIVAWDWVTTLCGIWLPALVAYIAKFIILRVGGSKLYEEQVVPFVGGFILGTTLEIFITALTSYALFPPPI